LGAAAQLECRCRLRLRLPLLAVARRWRVMLATRGAKGFPLPASAQSRSCNFASPYLCNLPIVLVRYGCQSAGIGTQRGNWVTRTGFDLGGQEFWFQIPANSNIRWRINVFTNYNKR
jgi:hypothetical protein